MPIKKASMKNTQFRQRPGNKNTVLREQNLVFFCCPSSSRTLHLRAQLWHTAPFRPNTLQLCYARPLQRPQVMAVPLAEFSGCRCVAWQSPSCSRCELKINGAGIVKGTRKEGRMEGCPKPKKTHEIYQFSSHINLHFISVFKTKNPSRVVFCCTSSPSQMVFCWFFLSIFG